VIKVHGRNNEIEMKIVKMQSGMKLQEYYKKSMGNFMRLSNYENQPILHPRY
jgi:hypothetical protein